MVDPAEGAGYAQPKAATPAELSEPVGRFSEMAQMAALMSSLVPVVQGLVETTGNIVRTIEEAGNADA